MDSIDDRTKLSVDVKTTRVFRKLAKPTSLPGIDSFNDYISNIKCDDDLASKISISVFVICGSFNSFIDLNKLVEMFNDEYKEYTDNITNLVKAAVVDDDEEERNLKIKKMVDNYILKEGGFVLEYKPDSKKSKTIKKKGEDSFYNSLKIKTIFEGNRICAKIFTNGGLQVAGCKTIETCHEIPQIIKDFIYSYKDSIKTPESFKLTNLKFGMINTKCTFNCKIKQNILKEIINKNSWTSGGNWRFATYQPSKYPGINAKFWVDSTANKWKDKYDINNDVKIPKKLDGQVAVLIFRSGSTIITGAKSEQDLKKAYDTITDLIRQNPECQLNNDSDNDSDSDSDNDSDSDSDSDKNN
jgi:TATA-box binding protein (TBP) (component of TFIID and TFIIIB)